MPNYGFNENEIVATKTIQIDKDGFHRIVEGTDGGNSTPDEGSTSGGLKDFNVVVACNREDENDICARALVRMGSDAHIALSDTADAISVGIAIDPLNSVDPSALPKTMTQEDMMEFANAHTFLSPTDMLIGVQSSDPELWIGDKSYMMYSTIVPNQADPSQYIDYAIPVGDLQSQEKIAPIFNDTITRFHYEFDLTILVASTADDDGNRNIFADVVHVITPEYLK